MCTYIYDHGHLIMGDLNVIQCNKFIKLMKCGTKFRTPSCTNINAILKQFTYDLDLYIYQISSSYNKPRAYFN